MAVVSPTKAETGAEGATRAAPTPAAPATKAGSASGTKWATKLRAAPGTKWAARAISLASHPGGRPALPVRLLRLRAFTSLPVKFVKIIKHCFSSPFKRENLCDISHYHLKQCDISLYSIYDISH